VRDGGAMFKTRITQMLGIKNPIVGGTMAAISEAGGIGGHRQTSAVGEPDALSGRGRPQGDGVESTPYGAI
jgi:NAD(P)H-dependent flavin oxidoreductase YrpB (nitropropane dioxygenase family)